MAEIPKEVLITSTLHQSIGIYLKLMHFLMLWVIRLKYGMSNFNIVK